MKTKKIENNDTPWMPKELSAAALGITIAAVSNVAIQFLTSSASRLPTVVRNFTGFSCGAAAIAGTVMAVYSMIRLSEKTVVEENELPKAVTVTALGGLSAALTQTIAEYFWTIAPSFALLDEYSIAYCIGTNLAWEVSAITGIASIVFTAHAAYRTGKAFLATMNPVAVTPLKN